MNAHKHITEFFCSSIGFFAGIYADVQQQLFTSTFAEISLITSMETIWYAFLGATVGLLVSFFGKVLLKKWLGYDE
jgi:hypothetical protein